MLAQGHTLGSIAGSLGVSRETVRRDAKKVLQTAEKKSVLQRQEQYMLALERLDAMQFAVWFRALKGDDEALNIVLSIHDRRMRLTGLERLGTALEMKKSMIEFLLEVAETALDGVAYSTLLDALVGATVPVRVLRGETRERDVLALPGSPN